MFNSGNYYYVGGNFKFFGVVFLCYCCEDFLLIVYMGGIMSGWFIIYDVLELFYGCVEMFY